MYSFMTYKLLTRFCIKILRGIDGLTSSHPVNSSIYLFNSYLYLFTMFTLLIWGCQKKSDTLFEKISAQQSQIHFNNKLTPTETLNAFTFTNYYNGGGIGVGDFNKDSLPDLFFSGNQVSCRLYLNQGNFQFEDITDKAGVTTDRWCTGVSIIDINQDGWDDIYVSVAHHSSFKNTRNLLYINQKTPTPTFKEEAQLYGLDYDGFTTQTAFFDYDLDGDVDAYMLNTAPDLQNPNILRPAVNNGTYPSTDKLFRNDHTATGQPYFKDVSKEAGIVYEGLGLGVVIADVNQDGYPDIYASNDFLSSDILYLNQKNGTFKNVVKAAFPHTSLFGMGIDAADINNDGKIDFFQLDMMPEDNARQKQMLGKQDYDKKEISISASYNYQLQYMRNTLQINQGTEGGTPYFSDMGLLAGVAKTDWSWATLLTDLDNDGRKDIFITTGYRKNITDLDFISFNQSNNYFGSDAAKNETREKLLAQVPEIQLRNYAYRNTQDLTFEDVSETWGLNELSYANGAVSVDLDKDGDMDLVVNNVDAEASIFKNKTLETLKNGYLKVNFKGNEGNIASIGATVTVWTKGQAQRCDNYPIRGYLSSVERGVNFGLGQYTVVDSMQITWYNGLSEMQYNIPANQTQTVDIANAKPLKKAIASAKTLFEPLPNLLDYQHQEADFNDFKQITALHKMFSKNGASAAIGDINGDNLADIVIGGAYRGSLNSIFLQQKNGQFNKQKGIETPDMEIGDMVLFDADNDKDNDLLVVGGSNERPLSVAAAFQPILYKNNGLGQFEPTQAIPNLTVSSQAVRVFDMDNDGDLDVFIGGRQTPNEYPMPASSYILRNDKGIFTDITKQVAPFLKDIGMVCDALPLDYDMDKDIDILLVGEWMPLTVLNNKNGLFEPKKYDNTEGWWNSIATGDFDKDGDMDLLLGNEGLNTFFHANDHEPITLYAKDFNADGQIDPIMGYYIKGKNAPALPRESLNQQIVQFRKKYTRYADYAKIGFDNLFSEKDKKDAYCIQAQEMHSCYAENRGNEGYKLHPLPKAAQASPIFSFLVADFDKDGHLDAVATGNFHSNEAHMGRQDASRGVFLKGNGAGQFEAISTEKSGLRTVGDARRSYFIDSSLRFFTIINSGNIIAHRLR
jgi:enediyne biosynthesis protein E4